MPIELLKPEVSSKIAAGEVIERPASAVKELVENALDAGASAIQLEVRGGGIEYIRITDNGAGIPSDQVRIAFQRFATSKLASAQDLDSITTLGFRGEALPSIAAVAVVDMRTRARDSDSGTRIEIEDGEVLSDGPTGAPVGTTVVVRHLFRRLPARRKFLRSPAAEQSRIQQVVAHYALAYPQVNFELRSDRGRPFTSPGTGELRDAVAAVHGREVAQAMLELVSEEDHQSDLQVRGLVGPPSIDRANRRYISLFANSRWVQNRSLSYAIEQSYHGFMAERRYPVAVVNVSLPFEDVDVNAHPAKSEIRFKKEGQVFGSVQRTIRRALSDHAPVPEVGHRPVGQPAITSPRPSDIGAFWPTTPFAASGHRPTGAAPGHLGMGREFPNLVEPAGSQNTGSPESPALTPVQALPILRVLGQVQNTYVVAEGPDGVFLIDQHAAHERVMFERVMSQSSEGSPEVQSLLEPSVVELDPGKMEMVQTHSGLVGNMGFVVEPFGGSAVMLRAVPVLLTDADPARVLIDVLDLMEEGGGFETWEERAAYSIACHGAIRAGKVMANDEMQELVRQLERCAQPNTCPHGRPTMIHMSSGRLEREFGRS